MAECAQQAGGERHLGVQLERFQIAGGLCLVREQLDQQSVHVVLDGVSHPGGLGYLPQYDVAFLPAGSDLPEDPDAGPLTGHHVLRQPHAVLAAVLHDGTLTAVQADLTRLLADYQQRMFEIFM